MFDLLMLPVLLMSGVGDFLANSRISVGEFISNKLLYQIILAISYYHLKTITKLPILRAKKGEILELMSQCHLELDVRYWCLALTSVLDD